MPVFRCRGVDPEGNTVRMDLTADSEGAAVADLRSRDITVVSVAESVGGFQLGVSLDRFLPVRRKDVILFFRMLSALIASDITISEAVMVLEEQTDKRKMKSVLNSMRRRIESGDPLSEAMGAHPHVFPSMVVNMVQAGELGGILDVVLKRVSDYLEKRAAIRTKTLISMMYPAIVLIVAIVVVIFLVVFVIPKFAILLRGRKLPANTQFLLNTADYLKANGLEIALGFACILGLIALLLSTPQVRLLVDRYRMKIPVIGPVFRYSAIVQFARTFGALLESHIPLVEALRATSATIGNIAVNQLLDNMVERVLAGEPLSAALERETPFTSMVRAMVKVGEHSGLMDEAMQTVAELHERVLEDKIARMSAMVEPVLIVVLGGIVGFVAWGLIAGMLAMYTAVK